MNKFDALNQNDVQVFPNEVFTDEVEEISIPTVDDASKVLVPRDPHGKIFHDDFFADAVDEDTAATAD